MGTRDLILLVEDNADDEALTIHALERNNIKNRIVVARNGEDALTFLADQGASKGDDNALPQVVLLDLNLPRMSGLDVLRQLRRDERTKLLPVVMLTSSREEEDIVTSYGLGANAYVRKPVDFSDFTQAVKTLGLFWLMLNEVSTSKAH